MFAHVVVDIEHSKIDRIFSYKIPDGADIFIGSRVLVPFGRANKSVEGYVLGFSETSDLPPDRIKCIHRVLRKIPEFTGNQLALANRIKDAYMTPLVTALRLMFPAEMRGERVSELTRRFVALSLNPLDLIAADAGLKNKDGRIKAPVMAGILDMLRDSPMALTALCEVFPSAASAVSAMEKKGWVKTYDQETGRSPLKNVQAHGEMSQIMQSRNRS